MSKKVLVQMLASELPLLSSYQLVNSDVDLLEVLAQNITDFDELSDYEQSQIVDDCKQSVKANASGISTKIYLGRCPQNDTRTYTLLDHGVFYEGDYIEDGDVLKVDTYINLV